MVNGLRISRVYPDGRWIDILCSGKLRQETDWSPFSPHGEPKLNGGDAYDTTFIQGYNVGFGFTLFRLFLSGSRNERC